MEIVKIKPDIYSDRVILVKRATEMKIKFLAST